MSELLESPRVSVIIPVKNDAARLRLCLEALARQTLPAAQWEAVVADNGSDRDDPAAAAAGFPNVRLVVQPKPGASAARNRAIAASRGTLLAFTDADCLPAPDWLERGLARMAALGGAGMVAGRIRVFPRDPARPNSLELFDMAWAFDQPMFVTRGRFGASANLWTDRNGVDTAGGFDETIPYYGEDVDLCLRLGRLGRPIVYADEVVVAHPARAAWAPFRARLERQVRAHYGYRPRGWRGLRKIPVDFWYDWLGPRALCKTLVHPAARGPRQHLRLLGATLAVKALRFRTRWAMLWEPRPQPGDA